MDYEDEVKVSKIEESIEKLDQRLSELNKEVSWLDSRMKKDDKKFSEITASAVAPLREAVTGLSLKFGSVEDSLSVIEKEAKKSHSHEEIEKIGSRIKSLGKTISALDELKRKINYIESIAYEASRPKFDPKEIEKRISKFSAELAGLREQIQAVYIESGRDSETLSNKIKNLENSLPQISSSLSGIEGSVASVKNLNDRNILKVSKSLGDFSQKTKKDLELMKSQIALTFSTAEKSADASKAIKSLEAKLLETAQKIGKNSIEIEKMSSLKSSVDSSSSEILQLRKSLGNLVSSQELEDLKENMDSITNRIGSAASKSDLINLKNTIESLQNSLQTLSSQSRNFATISNISEISAKLKSLESQLHSAARAIASAAELRNEFEKQKDLSEVLDEKISDVQSELRTFSRMMENKIEKELLEAGGSVENLEKSFAKLAASHADLETELNKVSDSFASVKAESSLARRNSEETEKVVESLKSITENLGAEINLISSELKTISEKSPETEKILREAKENQDTFEKRLSSIEDVAGSFARASEVESLTEKVNSFDNKIESAKSEPLQLVAELKEKLGTQRNILDSEIESFKSSIEEKIKNSNSESHQILSELKEKLESEKKSIETEIQNIRESLSNVENLSSDSNQKLRDEVFIKISSNEREIHGRIDGATANINSQINELRSSVESEFSTKSDLQESLNSVNEKISAADSKAESISKELKGEMLLRASPLVDDLKNLEREYNTLKQELKKIENLENRLSLSEGSTVEQIKSLRSEFHSIKKFLEEFPKDIKADSLLFKHRMRAAESEIEKLGFGLEAEAKKIYSGIESKVGEIKTMEQKFSEAELKLERIEKQNMLIARTLSDNMNILRDWSRSVEARISQIFELQTNLIREIGIARHGTRFAAEKS